jgi:hypothetical protein
MYPITEVLMADTAVIEVALDIRVTVKLEAEVATPEELRRLVERDPEGVRAAILTSIGRSGCEREAGWLDEDRCAFVTEVIDAESTFRSGHHQSSVLGSVIPIVPCVPVVVA